MKTVSTQFFSPAHIGLIEIAASFWYSMLMKGFAKALFKTYITLISLGSTFGATHSSQLHVSIHFGQIEGFLRILAVDVVDREGLAECQNFEGKVVWALPIA